MKQGEIWLIDLEPTVGAEMKKIRPAVIINDDALGRLPLKLLYRLQIGRNIIVWLRG